VAHLTEEKRLKMSIKN